jgi:uncharacterized membrane protein YhaH (DUF805 family)
MFVIGATPRKFFEIPSKPKRGSISCVVQGICKYRDTVRKNSSKYFDDRKDQIEKEGNLKIVAAAVVMMMRHEEKGWRKNPPPVWFSAVQLFFMIMTLVVFVIVLVLACASVFKIVAGWTIIEIDVETNRLGFGILAGLNAQNGGNIFPRRKFFFRNVTLTHFFEAHLGWLRTITADHREACFWNGYDLVVIIDKGQLDLAILCHEELKMWLDLCNQLSMIWSLLAMGSMIMTFVVMVIVLLFFIVLLISDGEGREGRKGESDDTYY